MQSIEFVVLFIFSALWCVYCQIEPHVTKVTANDEESIIIRKTAFESNEVNVDCACVCPENRGDKGLPGPPGYPGQDGIPGKPGRKGPCLNEGERCHTGPAGQKGLPGDNGSCNCDPIPGMPGPDGHKGVRGDPGYDGFPGRKGVKGEKGN
ncbi:collagen alpha-1(XXI) chain-like protein [Leptotrombidium deliense]|uniref:Collagen alpha-1(XXI) chain-like protein n=1 Tax=Leptotrombidium deliense TaxID=299467 RepID=A0A443S2Z8_9ACAR|nr:collagen alpha-1(XXI) chain-like protein [Leptotrombidium deliense]